MAEEQSAQSPIDESANLAENVDPILEKPQDKVEVQVETRMEEPVPKETKIEEPVPKEAKIEEPVRKKSRMMEPVPEVPEAARVNINIKPQSETKTVSVGPDATVAEVGSMLPSEDMCYI